jgi:hypothetical protein
VSSQPSSTAISRNTSTSCYRGILEAEATLTFYDIREALKTRFGIGNNKYSDALDLIQQNREARLLIGIESELQSLTDEKCRLLVSKHNELYPANDSEIEPKILSSSAQFSELFKRGRSSDVVIYKELLEVLSREDIADAGVIFYLGRNDELPETYEKRFMMSCRHFDNGGKPPEHLQHVFSKTNFRDRFTAGLGALGKGKLATELET